MSDERQDARSVRDRAERAERDAEHAERREDAMREDNIKAWATVRELRARVAELETIIAGRTTAPTDAEFAAHESGGGRWVVATANSVDLDTLAPPVRDWWARTGATRWIPVADDGRPCAWPVAP